MSASSISPPLGGPANGNGGRVDVITKPPPPYVGLIGPTAAVDSGRVHDSNNVSPSDGAVDANSVRIIHEIFDSYNDLGHEQALMALDNALDDAVRTIIIEPPRLGDETKRWITMGNFLHKCTVLSGLSCLGVAGVYPERRILYVPFGLLGLSTFLLYTISWQRDPCCRYQILTDRRRLSELPINGGNSGNVLPVVIFHRDDRRRRLLHSTISVGVFGVLVGVFVKRFVESGAPNR